uniref:Uncharacterized protein n=1 Tax=Ananas comosus var. bracteatus TaxID=296719 RepID=A0A6V7NTR8_ANACO|nr:unnamed protein product [Ananas comosus var. bracteatus]
MPNPSLGLAGKLPVYRYTIPYRYNHQPCTGTAINPVPVHSPMKATRDEESARAAVQNLHWSRIALGDRSLAGRDRSYQAGWRGSLGQPVPGRENRFPNVGPAREAEIWLSPENLTLGTGLLGKDRSPGDRSLRQGPVPEREISSAREGSSRGPVSPSWDRSLTAKTAQ